MICLWISVWASDVIAFEAVYGEFDGHFHFGWKPCL